MGKSYRDKEVEDHDFIDYAVAKFNEKDKRRKRLMKKMEDKRKKRR